MNRYKPNKKDFDKIMKISYEVIDWGLSIFFVNIGNLGNVNYLLILGYAPGTNPCLGSSLKTHDS